MEKQIKPENLFIRRKRWLHALAAAVFLAFGASLAILLPLALAKSLPESKTELIFLCIAAAILSAYSLLLAALNIRNLFFPFLLTSDEKGIYNFSGLFHYGFISWEDIGGFGKDATIWDMLDNEVPCIRIFANDYVKYKSSVSFGKKWMLAFGGGNVKIYTLCSQIKKNQVLGLLETSLRYYNLPEGGAVENE